MERVRRWAQFKQNEQLKKKGGTKKNTLVGIPKLDDANQAGSRNSDKCTLVLTEGDSAKSLAVSGLSVVGRDYYGVFPLKGKLLNVREAGHAQIMANEEVQNIVKILGLKYGEEYSDTRSLRYGSLLIMADQDHDGSHIKGLVINFLHHFWPSLLKIPGFLKEFITPIVKATKGKRTVEFFTLPEYEAWVESTGGARGWRVKYYKGLGTSTPSEARDYFSDLEKHVVPFTWRGDEDGDSIELAFAKRRVTERKAWLRQLQKGTHVDYAVDSMPYSEFVNKELILFSMADNVRSIPSVVDGLKPAQRKVLYCCFKRNLKRDIKVAQLAGYVSEHSCYHHGETALANTIIGMAQSFVGSNNVNLLEPVGQFGTRLQGGADAASPRYVFTRLANVTRAIFHPDDDAVLEHQYEDGQRIEPRFYVPVIPLVLVNGADGIGTGWSTSVPNYNPRDVINNLRRRLTGKRMLPMSPWWRFFKGDVEQRDAHRFYVRGRLYAQDVVPDTRRGTAALEAWRRVTDAGLEDELFDFEAMQAASTKAAGRRAGGNSASAKRAAQPLASWSTGRKLRITELPVRKWTEDYKRYLESMLVGAEKAAAAAAREARKKKPTGAAAKKKATGAAAKKKATGAAAAKKQKKGAKGREGGEDEDEPGGDDDAAGSMSAAQEKLGTEILAKVAPQGADEDVDFLVEMTPEASSSKELSTFKQLVDKFKLETTVGTTNMHLFDPTGGIVKYASALDVMEEFYDLRMDFYGKRKAHLLDKLEEDWGRADNKVRFIEAVLDGRLQVARRKKADLVKDLFERGFKMFPPASRRQAQRAGEGEEGGEEEGAAESASKAGSEVALRAKGYDYLLSLPLWSLTYEKVEELRRELEEKTQAVKQLRETRPHELWLRDLDALEEALDELQRRDEQRHDERVAQRDAYAQGKVLSVTKKKGGTVKKKGAARRASISGGAARRAAHQEAAAVARKDPYGGADDEEGARSGSGAEWEEEDDSDDDFDAAPRRKAKGGKAKGGSGEAAPSKALRDLMRPPFGRACDVSVDAPDPVEPAAAEDAARGGEGAAFRSGDSVAVDDPRVVEAFGGSGSGSGSGSKKGAGTGKTRKLGAGSTANFGSAWDDDEVEVLSLAERIRKKGGGAISRARKSAKKTPAAPVLAPAPAPAPATARGGTGKGSGAKATTKGKAKAEASAVVVEEEEDCDASDFDFEALPSDGEEDEKLPTPKPRPQRARRAATQRQRAVLSDSEGSGGEGESSEEGEEDEEEAYEPTPKPQRGKGRKRAPVRASTREAAEAGDAAALDLSADELADELMEKAWVTPQKKKPRRGNASKAAVKEKAPAKKAPAKKPPAKKAPAKKAPAKRAVVVEDSESEESAPEVAVAPRARASRRAAAAKATYRVDDSDEEGECEDGAVDAGGQDESDASFSAGSDTE